MSESWVTRRDGRRVLATQQYDMRGIPNGASWRPLTFREVLAWEFLRRVPKEESS